MCTLVRVLATTLPLLPISAAAQSLTVQQPVIDTFSVGTSVSVPDRGVMSVGGVGRAASRSSMSGFPPRRGAVARGASGSSVSAGVYIHDFGAMDAAVLNAASGSAPRLPITKGRYDDPTSYAMSRRWASGTSDRIERRETRGDTGRLTPAARRPSTEDVARFLALGEAAERRGKPELAALHYRYAARHGSVEARRRLASLAVTEGR